jgi:hypothetical protein
MKTPLPEFKEKFRSAILDLLWRQWNSLGVSGSGKAWNQSLIDPEALLLVSCTIARHEPRLFDAMIEWVRVNKTFLSISRVQRMLDQEGYAGGNVFTVIAALMRSRENDLKWARSASSSQAGVSVMDEALFFRKDGSSMPAMRSPDPVFKHYGFIRDVWKPRDVAVVFNPQVAVNLIMRLRALMGVNARCELLAYLLLHGSGSPRMMARDCGYYPATVTKALSEMAASGFLTSRVQGRHRKYSLVSREWISLMLPKDTPAWVSWIPLFAAIENIWLFLHAPERANQDPLALASDLRRLLNESVMRQLYDSLLPLPPDDYTRYRGEELWPYFTGLMEKVIDRLMRSTYP